MKTEINTFTGLKQTQDSKSDSNRLTGGLGALARKWLWRIRFYGVLVGCLVLIGLEGQALLAQAYPGMWESNVIRNHEILIQRFKAGETNLPLLRLSTLQGPLWTCVVQKSGKSISAESNGISNSTDWGRPPLSATNLQRLVEAMNVLPAKNESSIPLKRQIHVSGMRSNDWFHFVYDVDDLPIEVYAVFEIVGHPFPKKIKPADNVKSGSPIPAENVHTNRP